MKKSTFGFMLFAFLAMVVSLFSAPASYADGLMQSGTYTIAATPQDAGILGATVTDHIPACIAGERLCTAYMPATHTLSIPATAIFSTKSPGGATTVIAAGPGDDDTDTPDPDIRT